MNEFDRLHRVAKNLKERYPRGTRIMLLSMGDDPRPIESGTRGTVRSWMIWRPYTATSITDALSVLLTVRTDTENSPNRNWQKKKTTISARKKQQSRS